MSRRRRSLFPLAVAICVLLPVCLSEKAALEIFERACHCFHDHNVYSECEEEMRLGVEGAFHVAKDSVDEYCGGPCYAETNMALRCVEEVADEGFRFYNGATLPAVRAALGTGCGDTPERGTFEIRERKECGDDECYQAYHRRHEQEQEAGYGEQQYGYYCGAAGTGLRGLAQTLMPFFLAVSAALLPMI